jgi:biopolymer transport protein ExbD
MAISVHQARSIIRKSVKRVPEGESITHLNIMPMMDMMTILLVVFIFQVSTGAEAITAGNVELPSSVSQEPLPEASTVLIITDKSIVVEGKEVVAVRDGAVDAKNKAGGAAGMQIVPLTKFLQALRNENEQTMRDQGKSPLPPEVMIIADRLTPYRLLLEVMFSAKIKEAGYKRFRLITLGATAS